MKSEDFERLKAICEKEGFDILNLNHDDNEKYVLVKKAKDEWEGVEFVECILNSESYTVGKIYKRVPDFSIHVKTYFDDFGRENGQGKYFFKQSTEQAYVDQLKAKAFELYGDIKKGDRFDCSEMGYSKNASILLSKCLGLYYSKKFDSLELCGFTLYKQGKWAKKIEKVDYSISEKLERLNQLEEWMKKYPESFS